MRKCRKILYVTVLVVCLITFKNNVLGLDIKFESAIGGSAGSQRCTDPNSLCATDLSGSGFRISIVNTSGTLINENYQKNFVPNSSKSNFTSLKNVVTFEDVGIEGYSDISSDNAYKKYKNFFSELEKKPEVIKNILEKITGNKYEKLGNILNYYLKFEPIYALKEYSWGEEFIYAGTTLEILNSFGNKLEYTVYNGEKTGSRIGFCYVNGGKSASLLKADEQNICVQNLGGAWNATRNYIVGIYTPCSSSSSSNIFNSEKGKCYNKNDLNSRYATCDNNGNYEDCEWEYDEAKTNAELNKEYKLDNGLGVGYVNINEILKISKKIIVTKYDEKGDKVPNIQFKVCLNDDCLTRSTDNNGIVEFEFTGANTNSFEITETLKENDLTTEATFFCTGCSAGYLGRAKREGNVISQNFSLKNATIAEIDIYNLTGGNQCENEFNKVYSDNGNKISLKERYDLYEKYRKQGYDYNSLLNTKNTVGKNACKSTTCYYGSQSTCSNSRVALGDVDNNNNFYLVNYTTPAFEGGNYSCYTNLLRNNTTPIGLCLTRFEFLNLSNLDAEQWLINRLDEEDSISESNLTYKAIKGRAFNDGSSNNYLKRFGFGSLISSCALFDSNIDKSTLNSDLKYDEIVSDVKFIYNGVNKIEAESANPIVKKNEDNDNNLIKFYIYRGYKYRKTYIDVDGNLSHEEREINKEHIETDVFYSYFNGKDSGEMTFEYLFDESKIIENSAYTRLDNITKSSCPYELTPELIGDKPNLEFRVIDTSNPFPGIKGTTRQVGKNWCGNTYQGEETCLGTIENTKVSSTIFNANNSYNKNGTGAKYKIKLTSSDIKEIRKYNNETTYDDDDEYGRDSEGISCENGTDGCIRNFIYNLSTTGNISDGISLNSKLTIANGG